MEPAGIVAVALVWLAYGVVHSVLAHSAVKAVLQRRLPVLRQGYRLAYNVVALVLLIPPLWLTFRLPGEPLWQWQGAGLWLADGLALAALAGFVYSLRFYDGMAFLGLRQLRDPAVGEAMTLSPFHRWVRHPWYSFALVILWTRDMNLPLLTAAVVITVYFVIGSRLEERKLIEAYGERYRAYCRAVPALVPRPWRHLTPHQAQALLERNH